MVYFHAPTRRVRCVHLDVEAADVAVRLVSRVVFDVDREVEEDVFLTCQRHRLDLFVRDGRVGDEGVASAADISAQ